MFKIIEAENVRLHSALNMNDSKETIWIETHFKKLNQLLRSIEHLEPLRGFIESYKFNKRKSFLFCLSEDKDKLSQWRAYGDDGKGVCIGFDISQMNIPDHLPTSGSSSVDRTIGLKQVIYEPNSQFESIMLEVKKKEGVCRNGDPLGLADILFGANIARLSTIIKNTSFYEEQEWRIIHTPNENGYSIDCSYKNRISQLKHISSSNGSTPYYELNFGQKFCSKLIPEIVLGPKCKINSKSLSNLFINSELKYTKIIESESSYR